MPSLQEGILALQNEAEVEEFLSAILSTSEKEGVNNRWLAASMLNEGYTQRQVARSLKISVATVSRAAKLIRGKETFLSKLIGRVGTR